MAVEPQTDGERIILLAGEVAHVQSDLLDLEKSFGEHQRSVTSSLERIESQLHRQRGFIGAFMLMGSILGAVGLILQGWVSKKLGLA